MFGGNYLEKLSRIKKTSGEQEKNYFIKCSVTQRGMHLALGESWFPKFVFS